MLSAAALCLYHTVSFWGYGSSRTSRYSFCDSCERCFCVCLCVLCGRAILTNPHFLWNSKTSIQSAQQRHNSNSSGTTQTQVNLTTLMYVRTPVFPLFSLRPRGISSHPHPEGGSCIYIPWFSCFCSWQIGTLMSLRVFLPPVIYLFIFCCFPCFFPFFFSPEEKRGKITGEKFCDNNDPNPCIQAYIAWARSSSG